MINKSQFRMYPVVGLIIMLTLGISCLSIKSASATIQPAASSTAATSKNGNIVFAERFFDFGTITEGDIVRHTFKLRNDGAGTAKIVKAETSCGCTTASGALKAYAPGEQGEMEVVVDTKGKKGIVIKTVTVTMENNEVATTELTLMMKLNPPPHPRIGNIRNINTEAACKSCHLESGEGQSGVFLYHRVCSQCHGKKGVGGFARALNDAEWQSMEDANIKKAIHAGLPEQGMPSFVDGVTPPLTEEQVESLIQYIRSLVRR